MKTLFAPGCALARYKPERISQMSRFLMDASIVDGVYGACCKDEPECAQEVTLITCCPGCAGKFSERFAGAAVLPLWSVLLQTDFPFPDYRGAQMSIHDACRARGRDSAQMQDAARQLCRRMNIALLEPDETRGQTPCCGGSAPDYETRAEMARRRAKAFPARDVVVYCTGCVRSFSVTDASPRHLLDLLFAEPTQGLYPPKTKRSE